MIVSAVEKILVLLAFAAAPLFAAEPPAPPENLNARVVGWDIS